MLLTEFDNNPSAVIDPSMAFSRVENFPEVTISCFSFHMFDALLEIFHEKKVLGVIKQANQHFPVYDVVYEGKHFAFYLSAVGAPACTGNYEEIVAMGSKTLILFGNCGVLDKRIEDCGIIIPTAALRDEGTSYHYTPASDMIEVNHKYQDLFEEVLVERGYPFVKGMTWTTDAFFRETREKVNRRKEMGAVCVEMECAAVQAMCDFRKTEFFEFFYAGDNLDHSSWEPRSLRQDSRLDDKLKIAMLAFELGLKIMEKRESEKAEE